MTAIYFPLRTNVDYWGLEPLELDLESRMKLGAILYDELVFDDGIYVALIGPELATDIWMPMDKASAQLVEHHLPREGGEFAIYVDQREIHSQAQRRYQLSLRKILEQNGLASLPWVTFTSVDLTSKGKAAVDQMTERDASWLHDGDRETLSLLSHTLKSINHDWILATVNEWDVNMDPVHEVHCRQKLLLLAERTESLNPPVDFGVVFRNLPDLRRVTWEQIQEVRAHPSVVEFRKRLETVSQEARRAHIEGASADALRYQVSRWFTDQLIEELENRLVPKGKVIRRLAARLAVLVGTFMPGIGPLVSGLDDALDVLQPVAEYHSERKSLAAAFVRQYRQKHNQD